MRQINGNLALDETFETEISEVDGIYENSKVVYNKELDKKRARKRRKFDAKAKNKLKKLSKFSSYPSPAVPRNKEGKYEVDETKVTHYRKVTLAGNNGGAVKFIQRLTNKKVRHMNIEDTLTRNEYRRKYDKWWELF